MNPGGGSDLVTEKLRQALYLLNLCVCVCVMPLFLEDGWGAILRR